MPLQLIGKGAQKHVASDPVVSLVKDRAHFELHGLEIAEGFFDQAQLLVGSDHFEGGHLLLGHIATDNVAAVKESFGRDLVLVKAPQEFSFDNLPLDKLAHLGALQHPAHPCPESLLSRGSPNSRVTRGHLGSGRARSRKRSLASQLFTFVKHGWSESTELLITVKNWDSRD